MLDALRVVQLGLWVAIVGLGVSRIASAHRKALSGGLLARALRGGSRAKVADVLDASRPSPLAELAEVARHDDEEDAAIALREGTLRAQRAILRGIAPLRILGVLASAVGFVGVAHQISWISADHGLLDLDPVRVGRIATERAAVALALALAGSGTAVGLAAVLRARARAELTGLAMLQAALERTLPRWTADQSE